MGRKIGFCMALLVLPLSLLRAQWVYVQEGSWAYDLSSQHWMYVLPFYNLSLDYDYRGQGHAESIFDPASTEFSDRWLYAGYLPYIFDAKDQTWTKCQGLPLKWACELVPNEQGGYDSVWISAFDPLGKNMVPEEITIDTDLSLSHFIQAFSMWLVSFDIYIRPIEQNGEIHLFASPSTSNRQVWADKFNWNEETPAIYTKTNESEAEISLPDLGVKIHLNFSKYRRGRYQVRGPDNRIMTQSYSETESFDLNLAEVHQAP